MTEPNPNNTKIDLSQSLMAVMINTSFLYLQSISIYKDLLIPLSTHTISLELRGITAEMSNLLVFNKNAFFLSFFPQEKGMPCPSQHRSENCISQSLLLPQWNRCISHFPLKSLIGKT